MPTTRKERRRVVVKREVVRRERGWREGWGAIVQPGRDRELANGIIVFVGEFDISLHRSVCPEARLARIGKNLAAPFALRWIEVSERKKLESGR